MEGVLYYSTNKQLRTVYSDLQKAKKEYKAFRRLIAEVDNLYFENREEINFNLSLLNNLGTKGLGFRIEYRPEDYWAPERYWIYFDTPKGRVSTELHGTQGFKKVALTPFESTYVDFRTDTALPSEDNWYAIKIVKRFLETLLK